MDKTATPTLDDLLTAVVGRLREWSEAARAGCGEGLTDLPPHADDVLWRVADELAGDVAELHRRARLARDARIRTEVDPYCPCRTCGHNAGDHRERGGCTRPSCPCGRTPRDAADWSKVTL